MSRRRWSVRTSGPRRSLLPLAALAVAACASAPAAESVGAQDAARIQIGEVRVGTLSSGDPAESDGSRYDDYLLEVSESRNVQIDLTSDEFDTYLRLYSLAGGMRELRTDDDGGDGLDSRISHRLPDAGRYLIRATSYSSGGTGTYRLSVEDAGGDRAPRAIGVGDTRDGALDSSDPTFEGDRYEDWLVRVDAGTSLAIELTSDDFDTYLHVGEGVGSSFRELDRNDDGGEGLNSALTFDPPRSGEFVIRASSFSSGASGAYTLSVRRAIAPGETLAGRLERSDPMSGGKFYDEYVFQGEAGGTYFIDMSAQDLDTYLHVGRGSGASFSSITSNDDGGDGLDASIAFTPPTTGAYVIRATSFGRDAAGGYRLSLESRSGSGGAQPMRGSRVEGRLEAGDATASGGGLYDDWTFGGRAGERISVSLRSDDFDTVLELGTGTGGSFRSIASNDDGGDGLDSYLDTTLPRSGTFTLRVRSFGGSGSGFYVLERR